MAKECVGRVNRELPGQFRDMLMQDLIKEKNTGDAAARKVWKLINDNRFRK